jgi:hypothetical protein
VNRADGADEQGFAAAAIGGDEEVVGIPARQLDATDVQIAVAGVGERQRLRCTERVKWLDAERQARGAGGGRPCRAGVDGQAGRRARAGDEALVGTAAVEVGPADRGAAAVGPVDIPAIESHPERTARAGDEALVGGGAVEVRPADRAGG